MPNHFARFPTALAVPFVLSACADLSPAGIETRTAEAPVSTSSAVAGTVAAGPSIVEVALDVNARTGEFSTLLTALRAADLIDALDGPRPYTVFAPTDAAFDALPDGVLARVLGDTELLREVLLHHVTRGVRRSASVAGASRIRMLDGRSVYVGRGPDGALVGGARLVATDVEASNGIIHVIDAVLVPVTD